MGAYLGHFAGRPGDQFLALAPDFQAALDAVDMLGQPDESSIQAIQDRFLLRVSLGAIEGQLHLSNAPKDPVPIVNPDLLRLARNLGTGPTGDVLRSYGPAFHKCGYQHFPDQACKAFLETSQDLRVSLLAHPKRPGEGVIEVHHGDLGASRLEAGLVEVCDLDEQDILAVFPFLLRNGQYLADEAEACMEADHDALYQACIDAGIAVPELEDE